MASVVEICNLAIINLGHGTTISDFPPGDISDESTHCEALYEQTRDAVLAAHDWNFANKRIVLAGLGSPPSDYLYRYQFPTDCLTARHLLAPVKGAEPAPFRVASSEDRSGNDITVILTDVKNAELSYTAKITDPNRFPPLFIDALSWLLAARLAPALTKKKEKHHECLSIYQSIIAEARAVDSAEGEEDIPREAKWIQARL